LGQGSYCGLFGFHDLGLRTAPVDPVERLENLGLRIRRDAIDRAYLDRRHLAEVRAKRNSTLQGIAFFFSISSVFY
jgi:hypothetical protein